MRLPRKPCSRRLISRWVYWGSSSLVSFSSLPGWPYILCMWCIAMDPKKEGIGSMYSSGILKNCSTGRCEGNLISVVSVSGYCLLQAICHQWSFFLFSTKKEKEVLRSLRINSEKFTAKCAPRQTRCPATIPAAFCGVETKGRLRRYVCVSVNEPKKIKTNKTFPSPTGEGLGMGETKHKQNIPSPHRVSIFTTRITGMGVTRRERVRVRVQKKSGRSRSFSLAKGVA